MELYEIEARKAEIAKLIDTATAEELAAFEEEIRSLNAEIEERKAAAKDAAEVRSAVANGAGTVIESFKEETKMEIEVRNSKQYVDAFANYIKTGSDKECRALLTENASGSVPVPELVNNAIMHAWEKDEIISLVRKTYIKGNLKVGFEQSADAAVVHTEGAAAPSEEVLTLGVVELVPASIKKWITVSDEAMDLGSEAFLQYIYEELAHQIAKKAADTVVAAITASPDTSSATAAAVPVLTKAAGIDTVTEALGQLTDEASNPVVICNKATWATIKAAALSANYAADPFVGLKVCFNNSLPAYSAASTGNVYLIVGDLGRGAQANMPNGQEIGIKVDELSLAEKDLVKFVGRMYAGIGVVAPDHFVNVKKPA